MFTKGDKIRITKRNLNKDDEGKNGCFWAEEMNKFDGQILTFREYNPRKNINVEETCWSFDPDWCDLAEETTQPKPKWEEEFDKKLGKYFSLNPLGFIFYCEIKSFIRTLLSSQKAELIKEIEKMINRFEIDEIGDGKIIEKIANDFQVPVSVAANQMIDLKKEELKSKLKQILTK